MTRFLTPFGFHSTASDVLANVDLTGRSAIVTGRRGRHRPGNVALAQTGAAVTLAVRRPGPAEEIASRIRSDTGNKSIAVATLDLSDLRSVRTFVEDWRSPLHILVNNAGIMAVPELEKTSQGYELQFGTNYLRHFALTVGLRRALASANGARVVSLSSTGHQFSPVMFEDLNFDFVPYTPLGAYGQSKSATALLAVGLTQHWQDDGVVCNAVHPGAIATGLQKHTGGLRTPVERRKTLEQGAATSALLAGSPLVEGVTGRYFEDCNEGQLIDRRPGDLSGGYAAYAFDPGNAERLWHFSSGMIAQHST
jgi:NAD(P)-dependent dehydrogenase (short-subunit alcohol dehydrogenase family)